MDEEAPGGPRTRLAVRVLLAIVVLGVALVVGFRWWRARILDAAHERFRRAVAPVVARGEPLGAFDLERASDASTDPGRRLVAALTDLRYEHGDSGAWPDGPWRLEPEEVDALSGDERAALAAFVADLEGFYAIVDEATIAPELAFPLQRDGDGFVESVPVADLLLVRDLLVARAVCAETAAERVDALATLLRIARRLRPRSALHVLLAAQLVDTAARHTLAGLASGSIPPEARQRLDPLFLPSTIAEYPRMLRAERAWLLSVHDAFVDLPHVDEGATESLVSLAPPGMEEIASGFAEAYVVDSAAEVAELCERLLALPLADPAGLIDGARRETMTLREPDRSWWPWTDVKELLGRGIAIVAATTPEKLVAIEHRTRLARLALAAAEIQALHGAWPDRPRTLDGVSVLQPLGDVPFPYERRPDGSLHIGGDGGPFGEHDAGVTLSPR